MTLPRHAGGYRPEIVHAATLYGVDADLMEALVWVESAGNPWAWNPEPRYRYLWNVRTGTPFRALTEAERASETPPNDFPVIAGDRDQEWWGQQASWGLVQIMGAVAREHGWRDPYLPSLCDVERNLAVGCKHLKGLLLWAHGDRWVAVRAYNAGKGGVRLPAAEAYARKVQTEYARITTRRA